MFPAVRQRTIGQAVGCSGIGLHTGCKVNMRLLPAAADTGIIFRRVDLSNFVVPATVDMVARVSYATTLMRLGVMVATVEHVLSALVGCGIDNCIVELDCLEVPILDGSARSFVDLIRSAGIVEQSVPRVYLRVLERVEVTDGNRYIMIEPYEGFVIDSTIEFAHPLIGQQRYIYDASTCSYAEEIALARTFGFEREIATLRAAGLIKGGTLNNAIVLSEDGMLNAGPLNYEDEFARHKVLDIIGDLALAGWPIWGKVTAYRSGHGLHARLLSRLLQTTKAWELVEAEVTEVIHI
ncbi:MAG: UDP-3-O-acyl-N-acetylglucosamine deacetylase [Acidobacteriota bacterium]|nr:UDP-3-O-acyl-N-acetylglucosamine deacetylase [Blastocatellia bacterium]MDW8411998.1 UDP-3-O-acyl-N-acetylglucosamine deacetylase [Acidobacteriota bacterium]